MEKSGKKLSEYFYQYDRENNIYMKINHNNAEQVHVLIYLPTNLSIEQSIKLLKGSSSHCTTSDGNGIL
jgi:REP element-mobilizing transposase RayT